MPLTVYISSTQRDLVKERSTLKQWLEFARHVPICMEMYVAGSDTPVKYTQDDVKACDIYVCLTGERYGSKPAGSDKSFTEHEYLAAVQYEKEILLFTKECNSDDELEAFKKRVSPSHIVASFKDEIDLVLKVLVSLLSRGVRNGSIKPSGSAFNRDLIFFCDRETQYNTLDDLRWKARGRPVLFSIEGKAVDGHWSFITRLKNIAEKNKDKSVRSLFFEVVPLKVDGYASAEAVSRQILIPVLNKLEAQGAVIDDEPSFEMLNRLLNVHSFKTVLIIIYIHQSSINNKQKLQKYREGISAFSKDIGALAVGKEDSLFIAICLEEQTDEYLAPIVAPLPEQSRLRLTPIPQGDVSFWLQKNEIERDPDRIQKLLQAIYKDGTDELPLAAIERELEIIIQAYNSKI